MHSKVTLITGASSGIGEATAVHFASLGCWLSLAARNMAALEAVAERCRSAGIPKDKVLTTQCDVRCADDIAAVLRRTASHFGRIDIVVNNAGIVTTAHLGEISLEDFNEVMDTNLRSAFIMTQECLPYLKETKGTIVNVSSMLSKLTVARVVPYSISKAALDKLTRLSALQFAMFGIRVNAVSPGVINTKMLHEDIKDIDAREKVVAGMGAGIPMGRVGTVDDVARAVAFLASDDASFITGHVLPVDGGIMLSGMPPVQWPTQAQYGSTPPANCNETCRR